MSSASLSVVNREDDQENRRISVGAVFKYRSWDVVEGREISLDRSISETVSSRQCLERSRWHRGRLRHHTAIMVSERFVGLFEWANESSGSSQSGRVFAQKQTKLGYVTLLM